MFLLTNKMCHNDTNLCAGTNGIYSRFRSTDLVFIKFNQPDKSFVQQLKRYIVCS